MDEILEELYELLYLYFNIEVSSGVVKTNTNVPGIEPPLDFVIFQEDILEKIIQKSQELHTL